MQQIERFILRLLPTWLIRLGLEASQWVEVAFEKESLGMDAVRCYIVTVAREKPKGYLFGIPFSLGNLNMRLGMKYQLHIVYINVAESTTKRAFIYFREEKKQAIYRIRMHALSGQNKHIHCVRCKVKRAKYFCQIENAIKPWSWIAHLYTEWGVLAQGYVCSEACAKTGYKEVTIVRGS